MVPTRDDLPSVCYVGGVPDVFTKAKRSLVMAAIRSRGNKDTELKFAAMLRAAGITGWRRHQPLPGRPDFMFRRARLAIFVDGCFWHGCRWHGRMPKTRAAFWKAKIRRNQARDAAVAVLLRTRGWRVLRIWEHSLQDPSRVLAKVAAMLEPDPGAERGLARSRLVEAPARPEARRGGRKKIRAIPVIGRL